MMMIEYRGFLSLLRPIIFSNTEHDVRIRICAVSRRDAFTIATVQMYN